MTWRRRTIYKWTLLSWRVMTVVCQACVVVHIIITHQGRWYLLFLIIWHNSCFTGTRKHNNPYQRSVFSLKRHPPHLLQTRYWLSVYSWWWTAWLSIQERACLGLHILTAHIFQPLLPRQRHTHIHKGMVLILFEQLLLKGNTSANIGLQWSRQNWFINEWVCHSVSLRLSYVLKLILVAYRKWFPPFRKFAYSFSFWVLHEMSWICV